MTIKIVLFPSLDGWRLHLVGGNNRVLASSESYATKQMCMKTAAQLGVELGVGVTEEKPKGEKQIRK